jgi:hypothetical protein
MAVQTSTRIRLHLAVSQIVGFVMNCNNYINLDEEVFMNHGWRDLRLFAKLDDDKSYQLHVKMKEVPSNEWQGHITAMDRLGTVVTIFEGITVSSAAAQQHL